MSGIKSATVRNTLEKVVELTRAGIAECAQIAAEAGSVGRSACDRERTEANRLHAGMHRTLPEDLREFLKGMTDRWDGLVRLHDEKFAEANRLFGEAGGSEDDFSSRRRERERTLEQIDDSVRRIRGALQGKEWYCDAENAEALGLRSEAERILGEMHSDVSLGRQAQELRRRSVPLFSESGNLALEADREYQRLVDLARDRQKRQRIREEQERRAGDLEADIRSLRSAIESKNHAKFGGASYTKAVQREAEDVLQLIADRAYEKALPRAERIKDALAAAVAKIDAAQRAWEKEKLEAERTLADAREEAGKADRDVLATYSGASAGEVDALFGDIEGAAGFLSSERFGEARDRAAAAVAKLRELAERASGNHRLARQREEVAQSIMQAFCDANYDTPSYYMQDEADELSDLCIVAAAPGGVGDMRMRISLSGETKFEVGNIPEGSEQLCIDQIRDLQKRLAESDVRFDVTDWGRAANANKVHLDVRPKQTTVQTTVQRQG